MQARIRVLLALLCLTASGALRAQACGTELSGSVTLTRDMDCRGYPYAFKAARDGVVVRLNGRTIRGDLRGDGIVVNGYRGVVVQGPGRLLGLRRAVAAARAESLKVAQVDIVDSSYGVELITSRYARIERNTFTGNRAAIEIRQPAASLSSGPGRHVIYANTFNGALGSVFYGATPYGLRLCGADAGENYVSSNRFDPSGLLLVEISHEADANRIEGNKFLGHSQLVITTSNANSVAGNVFEAETRGILVVPSPPGEDCLVRRGDAKAAGNKFLHNYFYGSPIAISLGHPHLPGSAVSASRIGDNRIEGAAVGIVMHANSYDNDARFNDYIGVTTWVIDEGFGNVY